MQIECTNKAEISSPAAIANVFKSILASESELDKEKEHFWTVGVNNRNVIKYIELVSLGTLNQTLVQPREVFRTAIFHAASRIFICHNHPSNSNFPSKEDREITQKLKQAGDILEIKLLDHIIITKNGYYSFSESKEL